MKIHSGLIVFALFASATVFATPPSAVGDNRTVPKNTAITIDVLDNDFDPDGDNLSIVTDSVSQPANGTVTVNSDGGVSYTPNVNFVGTDRFSYTIVDNSEGQEQASANVTVNVVDPKISISDDLLNARNIASTLDSICGTLSTTDSSMLSGGYQALADNCSGLLALFVSDPIAGAYAIQQISPDEALALVKLGSGASNLQSKIVSNRMIQLTQNTPASSSTALSWSGHLAGGSAGENDLWSRVGVFASVQLEGAEKQKSSYETGFDYRSNGITFGADYALTNAWFAGAALGWTKNDLDYNNDGNVDTDVYTLVTYSTYEMNNLSVDIQAGAGQSKLDIYRNISYGNSTTYYNSSTDGRTNGSQWFMKTQIQYMWNHQALTLYPSLRYRISHSHVNGYADTNGGGWDVILDDQNTRQQTLELGLQGTYALKTSWGIMIPTFELNAVSDLDTDQDLMHGRFAYAPPSQAEFVMYGEPPESVFYLAGIGSTFVLPNGGNAFININKTLGYSNYSAVQFQFGFRFEY